MFNNFIKKTSKFFAVLLTVTLAFTPLSYGAEVFTFTELKNALSDGSITTIDIGTDITAGDFDNPLGSQVADSLTINGKNYVINANNKGGMTISSGQTTTIKDIVLSFFKTNSSVGAIYNNGGVLNIENISFSSNSVRYNGGAIYNSNAGKVKIGDNSSFNFNNAGDGGAIFSSSKCEITMGDNIDFNSNTATGVGGAIRLDGETVIGDNATFSLNTAKESGGAIYITLDNYSAGGGLLTIGDNVVFSSNTALGFESEENGYGGAIYVDFADTLTIGDKAIFEYNKAKQGGAINNNISTVIIGDNVSFSSNAAIGGNGGAIYNLVGTTLIDGGNFSYNTATGKGGAIYNTGKYYSSYYSSNLILLAQENNMEFTGNTAAGESNAIYDDRGTIYLWAGDNKNITFNDKIVSNDDRSVMYINPEIEYEDVLNVSSGTGKIVLNEDMSGYKGNVNLYGGILEMNSDYDDNGYKFFDTENFVVHAGTFTANASSMLHDFVNNGMTEFSGGTNEVAITGTGTLQITGEVENIEGTNIEQNELIVTETGSFSANVNDLSITNSQIQNAGDLIFVGTTDMTNDYVIDGMSGETGTTYGNLTVKGNLENNAAITQNNVTVENGLFTNNKTITANNLFTNEGETINLSTITAQNVVNSGILTSNASDIVADSVFNEGEYNITGGTVSYKIKGGITNGTVNIKYGEVTLSADSYISQNNINLAATLNLGEDTSLRTSTLNIEDGAELNTINDKTRDIAAEAITIASGANWNWSFDMDLESLKADMLSNVNAESGSTANIKGINIIKDRDGEYFLQIADANINAVVDSDTIQLYTTTSEYTITAFPRPVPVCPPSLPMLSPSSCPPVCSSC